MHKTVSIIFPNFNGGQEPLECLDSIAKLAYPKSKIEVLVIDNNSTDGSPQSIIKLFPWVKLIRLKENVGFIQAVNHGIHQAKGAYIFIGNDDLVFSPASLGVLINYIEKNKDVGALGGKVYYKNFPQEIASAGYMFDSWTGHIYCAQNSEKLKEVDWIQGCALLTTKLVIKKVGLFDEGFGFIYFEDTDFCFRVRQQGFKVTYLPTVEFWHGNTTTMNKNKPRKYYEWYKNKFRFMLKHLPLINICCIFFIQGFLVIPYRALILQDGRFIAYLKGLAWNIKHLRETLKNRYATD